MKKTKFLVLVLVVSVMLLGAGYAAWTDTLYITNTVKTGNLDVEFVDLPGNDELSLSKYEDGYVSYSTDANEWDVATATIYNVYPGGNFSIKYKMKNTGTIPVLIDSLGADYGAFSKAAGGTLSDEGISSGVVFYDKDNKRLYDNIDAHPWNGNYKNLEIPVGGSIEIYVNFGAVDYAENDTITVTMTPTFKQFNK